mmetsp:Transcript_5624/g.13330  ORF Transcript_5624/g.13330 Transcript_5624/m.13330 type:complete len:257 (-) Transcript_5624:908-1678(-)
MLDCLVGCAIQLVAQKAEHLRVPTSPVGVNETQRIQGSSLCVLACHRLTLLWQIGLQQRHRLLHVALVDDTLTGGRREPRPVRSLAQPVHVDAQEAVYSCAASHVRMSHDQCVMKQAGAVLYGLLHAAQQDLVGLLVVVQEVKENVRRLMAGHDGVQHVPLGEQRLVVTASTTRRRGGSRCVSLVPVLRRTLLALPFLRVRSRGLGRGCRSTRKRPRDVEHELLVVVVDQVEGDLVRRQQASVSLIRLTGAHKALQ